EASECRVGAGSFGKPQSDIAERKPDSDSLAGGGDVRHTDSDRSERRQSRVPAAGQKLGRSTASGRGRMMDRSMVWMLCAVGGLLALATAVGLLLRFTVKTDAGRRTVSNLNA